LRRGCSREEDWLALFHLIFAARDKKRGAGQEGRRTEKEDLRCNGPEKKGHWSEELGEVTTAAMLDVLKIGEGFLKR